MKILGKRLTIVGLVFSVLFAVIICFAVYSGEEEEAVIKTGNEQYKELENGIYIGEILNGKLEGTGNLRYYVGDVYTGEFSDDKKNGEGEYTYADGSSYRGEYSNGKRDGTGTFQFKDGSSYTGQWENDMIQGNGEYTSKDGKYLKGIFRENSLTDGSY